MRRFVSFGPAFVVLVATLVVLVAAPSAVRRVGYASTGARVELAAQVLEQDNVLEMINRATKAIADRVRPAIVHIEIRSSARESGRIVGSTGSGWLFDDAGHVVTNAHVVRSGDRARVTFFDGRMMPARVIGRDPLTDIAVVRVEADGGLFPLDLATHRLPEQGERAFAFGSPFGFRFSMTEGIVSGLGRTPSTADFGEYTNFIQHDAAVNPGNSGGPLIDVQGRVIGMNTAIATGRGSGEPDDNTGDSAGISFAIPVGTIEPVVRQLIEFGRVERGFLGIRLSGDAGRIEHDDGRVTLGALVEWVDGESPAFAAGLQAGDVITEVDGYPVDGQVALQALVASRRPGERVGMTVVREDGKVSTTVELGKLPTNVLAERVVRSIVRELGVEVTVGADGPLVLRVLPEGTGYASGFRAGQTVLSIGGRSVDSPLGFYGQLGAAGLLEGETVSVEVLESGFDAPGRKRTLEVSIRR